MTRPDTTAPRTRLRHLRGQLCTWLAKAAYPLWSTQGIDAVNGGFIETLAQDGTPLPQARRARVHPRQVYAFAQAGRFGWSGDARGIVRRGLDYFERHYRRPDGLFRTLAGVDGAPLEDRALLYDQSFALLGYSAAAVTLDEREVLEQRAVALRETLDSRLRAGGGAFRSDESARGIIESNPHMHLLEACLAWAEIGRDPAWSTWARRLVDLAVTRFIRADGGGALGECFAEDWQPAPGVAGRIVEPGHQFEWAWLLLRAERHTSRPVRAAALRLIEIGEHAGVHNRVAVNALLDDLSVHDPKARFWPQTERLKASLLAAELTGEPGHWAAAAAAAASLLPYLETPVAGLWYDVQLPSGEMVDAPAPASTFYHLVGAILALDRTLAAERAA